MITMCPFCGGEGHYVIQEDNKEKEITCKECQGKGFINSGRVTMVREKLSLFNDSGVSRLRY